MISSTGKVLINSDRSKDFETLWDYLTEGPAGLKMTTFVWALKKKQENGSPISRKNKSGVGSTEKQKRVQNEQKTKGRGAY